MCQVNREAAASDTFLVEGRLCKAPINPAVSQGSLAISDSRLGSTAPLSLWLYGISVRMP